MTRHSGAESCVCGTRCNQTGGRMALPVDGAISVTNRHTRHPDSASRDDDNGLVEVWSFASALRGCCERETLPRPSFREMGGPLASHRDATRESSLAALDSDISTRTAN